MKEMCNAVAPYHSNTHTDIDRIFAVPLFFDKNIRNQKKKHVQ